MGKETQTGIAREVKGKRVVGVRGGISDAREIRGKAGTGTEDRGYRE